SLPVEVVDDVCLWPRAGCASSSSSSGVQNARTNNRFWAYNEMPEIMQSSRSLPHVRPVSRKGQVSNSLLRNVCPASGPFTRIFSNSNTSRVNMHDPNSTAPSHKQSFHSPAALELLLFELLSGGRLNLI